MIEFLFAVCFAIDGDTLRCKAADDTWHRIRIAGINSPESRDPGGFAATTTMSSLIRGRQVRCEWRRERSYRRKVARCYVGKTDLGAAMIARGRAQACKEFLVYPKLATRCCWPRSRRCRRMSR